MCHRKAYFGLISLLRWSPTRRAFRHQTVFHSSCFTISHLVPKQLRPLQVCGLSGIPPPPRTIFFFTTRLGCTWRNWFSGLVSPTTELLKQACTRRGKTSRKQRLGHLMSIPIYRTLSWKITPLFRNIIRLTEFVWFENVSSLTWGGSARQVWLLWCLFLTQLVSFSEFLSICSCHIRHSELVLIVISSSCCCFLGISLEFEVTHPTPKKSLDVLWHSSSLRWCFFLRASSGKRIPSADAVGATTGRGFKLGRQATESHRTCCWCHQLSPRESPPGLFSPSQFTPVCCSLQPRHRPTRPHSNGSGW